MRNTDIFANPYYAQFKGPNGGMGAAGYASIGADVIGGGLQFASALEQSSPNFNVNTPGQMSVGGRPQYNLGSLVSQSANFNKKDYGRGLVGQGVGAGLKMGTNPLLLAATGGWSAPIGAVAGAIGGLIGRGAKRRKAEEMQEQRSNNIRSAQNQYNTQSQNYNQGYLARQQYEDQWNN